MLTDIDVDCVMAIKKLLVAYNVIGEDHTGSVTFNYFIGGCSNVEKYQSLKPAKKGLKVLK